MRRFCLLFLVPLLALTLAAPPVLAEPEQQRPKVGLALSGGGARGIAHVGVLRALEEMGTPIDYIAGTSMGAIVGGLYASGYDSGEILRIVEDLDWEKAMTDRPERIHRTMRSKDLDRNFLIPYRVGFNRGRLQFPLGVVEGQHLDQVFQDLLMPVAGVTDFDALPIPFRAVATDLATGDEVVLGQGSLANALRASMSVPGVFAPVTIDDRLLVDGGMSNNLPVDVVREMGADIVIAVDISSPMLSKEELTSVLSVTEQLTNFLTRWSTENQIDSLGPRDVLVVPDLEDFSSADFHRVLAIVDQGYEAAEVQRDQLAQLPSAPRRTPREPPDAPSKITVEFVEVENDSVLDDRIIRSRLDVRPGQVVDLSTLNDMVDEIYSLGVFQSVTYDFVEGDEGETGLVVDARRRTWGPNYLQFGLELSSDFAGISDYTIGAAYTRNALNSLGGELRVTGSLGRVNELAFDFYQPIDHEARWYIRPEAYWSSETYRLWVEDVNVAELDIEGWGATLSLGRNFNTTNRLQLGYRVGRADVGLLIGDPGIQTPYLDVGELRLEYLHDSLDSVWFPTRGALHRLEYRYANEALGANSAYDQATASGTMAFSLGRNTAALSYELGYSFDDDVGVENWYRLGGFGRISGLAPDQLLGRQVGLATLAVYRRLNNLDLLPVYAGFTLETGNAWLTRDAVGFDDLRYAGSVFLGAESPLGPLYFATGYADSGDFAVYFYLGNPFRVSRFD
jgi:NTE family protein